MKEPKLVNDRLRVLLSWEPHPHQVPPIKFSNNQLTLCTEFNAESVKLFPEAQVDQITPSQPYDIHRLVRQEMGYKEDFDLVVVMISGIKRNLPYNINEFGCPTVAIVADTHHGYRSPIGEIFTYLSLESYDYIIFPYCRHHMHWFYACGFNNLGWLPLITMTTVTHDFQQPRSKEAVFICGDPLFHPQRHRVIECVQNSGLPFRMATLDRFQAAKTYSESLISLHCSLNGDLALRNLEIVSAGGFLLADRLSPQSGFEYILKPGEECDVYTDRQELLEKIAFYLDNPTDAISMASRSYDKFFEILHPNYRINDLYRWIFNGDESREFLFNWDTRMEVSRQYADYLETRVRIYEQIQELHKLQETVNVLVDSTCPIIFAIDIIDLPRAKIHVSKGNLDAYRLVEELGLTSQVHWVEATDQQKIDWDVYLYKGSSSNLNARFHICLDEQNSLFYSDLAPLNQINLLRINYKDGHSNMITYVGDNSGLYAINEIFQQSCYPIFDFIDDVKLILDIGAGMGISTAFFRANYPTAWICAFEEDRLNYLLLGENARKLRGCIVYCSTPQQVITFLEQDLPKSGIERIDIVKIDAQAYDCKLLQSITVNQKFTPAVIYVKFYDQVSRLELDKVLTVKYLLWSASIREGKGYLAYMRRDLIEELSDMSA